MVNDLFILGDTDINILNNGQNILDKYKDMSKRKSNFGAIPKKHAQICSTLGLKQLIKHPTRITCHTQLLLITLLVTVKKRLLKVVLSILHYLTISLFFAIGKSRE